MRILVKYVIMFPCLGCEHADVFKEGLPPVHRQLQGKTYFRVHMVGSAVFIKYYFKNYIKNAHVVYYKYMSLVKKLLKIV
jgi:hypothetical protein